MEVTGNREELGTVTKRRAGGGNRERSWGTDLEWNRREARMIFRPV